MNLYENFKAVFESEEMKAFLKKGFQLKNTDKSTSKKLTVITFLSCVGMTVLGFFALGIVGAILFFIISYVSTFALTLSTKKKVLLAYLAHYRTKLPSLLANAEKIDKPDRSYPIATLYPDALYHWTVCYKFDDVYSGLLRILKGSQEEMCAFCTISQENAFSGVIHKGYFPFVSTENFEDITFKGVLPDSAHPFAQILEKHFSSFVMVFSSNSSLLLIPDACDFMAGRVEDKDDLYPKTILRQYAYTNISKAFTSLDVNLLTDACKLLESDTDQFLEVYNKCEENAKKS